MRRRTKILLAIVLVVLVLFVLVYVNYRNRYPYGVSHCCDIQLYFALYEYAQAHDGVFPAGEATPEASLSLLCREKTEWAADANLLRGKTVPESVVQEVLDRGELLTPETCGWHYVEGLNLDDHDRLALFWDKVGLDHNGGELPAGGHIVYFVGGYREYIPETEWEKFLEEQRNLHAQRASRPDRDRARKKLPEAGSRSGLPVVLWIADTWG
ncbi:MAG: hypothetical protein PVH19_01235 [Planctomycetia bacterium]|jgi:hypothetical protein